MNKDKKKIIAMVANTPIYLGTLALIFSATNGNAAEAILGIGTAVSGGIVKGWGYGVDVGINSKIIQPLKRDLSAAKARLVSLRRSD
jgi:hypothetical protein